ncbi:MAG: hypothetical protein LC101_04585 [Flavobacteriales bacterium]|nr:hypothetical protein [Flavobacteriales bacterium]MCZ2443034.1 hypothetical protein [Flavobacteriales bacterium]
MRIFITLLFFVLASKMLHAQQGTVVIHYDPGVESSINAYIASAQEEKLKGFRVQLCSESGNNAKGIANAIKSRFLQRYRNVPAYLIWESPNFKVRVGDFKTRLDATLFWKQVQDEFLQSYVVMDQINPLKFSER